PPVPPGLGMLTAAQRALADFLRLDGDLLAIAAHTSPPLEEVADDPGDLAAWVNRLPVIEKNRLLGRVVQGEAARVRMEMLRRFHGNSAPVVATPSRRTVADLLDNAAWSRVEAMIATRKPAEYDAAITLLTDLQALAGRDGHCDAFTLRATALRQTHARK